MENIDDFQRRLSDSFPTLTKSEQRIASYLLSSHDEAAFLPAAEIAKRLDVSEATIVRFAKAIGYDSFPELRRVLQEIFRLQVTPATRLKQKLADLKTGEGNVLSKIVEMEIQYLTEALHSIQSEDLDCAVDLILKGRNIYIFGVGPSRILADLVELRLRRFGFSAHGLTESGRDLADQLLQLQKGDVLLATGFHRLTGELVAVLGHAQALGCKSILLTDVLGPTFKDKVDVILSARRGPVSTFHSLTVPMAILNAIILAVAMSRSESSLLALDRLQELRETYGLDIVGKLTT
jgi:DNA-binding MurR/RpiR family transcriptional regulator